MADVAGIDMGGWPESGVGALATVDTDIPVLGGEKVCGWAGNGLCHIVVLVCIPVIV